MRTREITRRRFVAGALGGGASLWSSYSLSEVLAQPARDSMIAINDVTVIDASGASPRPQTTVVIEGNRIAEIRPTDAAQVPEGVRVVDGSGRFLIPGLWDAHTHTFVFP